MLSDLLNSLQKDGAITEAVSLRRFRWDFIRSCGFRDIKGFEHELNFGYNSDTSGEDGALAALPDEEVGGGGGGVGGVGVSWS